MMRTGWMRVVAVAFIVLIAFAGGYAVGQRKTQAWLMPLVAAETHFNLAQRVEALARIRTGDAAGAIASMEHHVDTATLNLPQGKAWSALAPDVRFTLQLAKVYRERYPPAQPNPGLSALLARIPTPDRQYCSPAVQKLLLSVPVKAEDR